MDSASRPEVTGFFDQITSTVTYVVADPASRACAIIDPVLDYEAKAGRITTAGIDRVAAFVRRHDFQVQWVLDTHIHADHLSGASFLRAAIGGRIGIGAQVGEVQEIFREYYNLGADFPADGSQFDHIFADGEEFSIGGLTAIVHHAPGHTPACVAYHIGDALFTGDTLLMPDFGTARCDFPGGDATTLYESIRRLLALPPATRVFVGHDYGPNGREIAWETTIAAQKAGNVHIRDGVSEDMFVDLRTRRDATLEVPILMLPAVQVNIRGGRLPQPEGNGATYLKVPITRG
jgi:glyoxylase-like metal-dependent hydrolase (beta-lactamase superfamily II)